MLKVLILDDDERRHGRFRKILVDASRTHVYTARQAIAALESNPRYDLVCLDHDLDVIPNSYNRSDSPGDGTDVANYIRDRLGSRRFPRNILIHSVNKPAAARMASNLRPTGIPVKLNPFPD